ncbi:MAG: hypothetical protein HY754_14185, partial [Nitrospirae bacterium]|nr:hypothetical protein [Nitrospirota bacterium]
MDLFDNRKLLKFLMLILIGITFVSLFLILLKPIEDLDFFWHLATGRWIVEHKALLSHDPFNYTTPAFSTPMEYFILTSYWLSQIFYYGIYHLSGWNGFILLRVIVTGIIIYFLYKRGKDSDKTILIGIITVTIVVFSQIYYFERPQVFSFLSFAILLYLLDEMKRNSGAEDRFIVGQMVILIYLLSEGFKFLYPSLNPMKKSSYLKFFIAGMAGILTALINPAGYNVIVETVHLSKYAHVEIIDIQSTVTIFKAFYKYYIPVYWLLLLTAMASLLYRIVKKRFDIKDVFMIAGLGYFSFTQLRHTAFFLIWAAPFISLSWSTVSRARINYIKIFCSLFSPLIIIALTIGGEEFSNIRNITGIKTGRWISSYFPEDAVRF